MLQDVVAAVSLVAVLLCGWTAVVAWRRRHRTYAAAFLVVSMVTNVAWCLVAALSDRGLGPTGAPAYVLAMAAVHAVTAAFWCLAACVTDPQWRLRRRTALLLAVAPVVVVTAAATNPWHGAFLTPPPSGRLFDEDMTLGPLFLLHALYCYVLASWGFVRLAVVWRRAPAIFRRQAASLMVAVTLPSVAVGSRILFDDGLGAVDTTPLGFAAAGLLLGRAVLRQGLLTLVPVARAQVVDTLLDAVFVVDHGWQVVDVNPSGRALLARVRPDLPADVVGMAAAEVFPDGRVRPLLAQVGAVTVEAAPGLHLDLRSSLQVDSRGHVQARVLTAQDVSEAVTAERRLREQLATIEALQERLQEEAVRDTLTGLHNRRYLVSALDAAVAADEPFALVLLDVDHFKAVNDTHGHQSGDDVLCAVARQLAAGTRGGDALARWGGEEFVVLLHGADTTAALLRAEELRLACAAGRVPVPDGRELSVTVSLGVAARTAGGPDARELLAAADAALYEAKATGRDRAVAAWSGAAAGSPAGALRR